MEEVVHNVRENWTEEEWNDYYQTLAETEEELDEDLAL